MVSTTIAIEKSTRDKLAEFKLADETFNDLLLRLYKSACERQLQELLMDTTNCVPIEKALNNARKKWQK